MHASTDRTRVLGGLLSVCAFAACGGGGSIGSGGDGRDAWRPRPGAPQGMSPPIQQVSMGDGGGAARAVEDINLQYFGGPIVPSIKVVQILYGHGTYLPGIAGQDLGVFYQQITNSTYWDWLGEYDTAITGATGAPGTNQALGHGEFAGTRTIIPAAAHAGTELTDEKIHAELEAQIAAGHLPAPDAHTVYMVNLPAGVSVTMRGAKSCAPKGFCGYHSTFMHGSQFAYYGVLPDVSSGGCAEGCGKASDPFDLQTAVASHELAEVATNPAVGQAFDAAPPLSWYDLSNGEIGDICNGVQAALVAPNGSRYWVQAEYSLKAAGCIVTRAGGIVQ